MSNWSEKKNKDGGNINLLKINKFLMSFYFFFNFKNQQNYKIELFLKNKKKVT